MGIESKIFDPRDRSCGSGGAEVSDASVVKRGDQWWMYLAGQAAGYGPTQLYSATLPRGAALSATGWTLTRDAEGRLAPLAAQDESRPWDGNGGRHCPSYARGWDPRNGAWVERIYYAGAADHLWGPYTIGFLEWNSEEWIENREPAFAANEEWERGSVYEPNLIYHDGKWRMWYVAGANQEDYLIHGYAESEDGRGEWSKHTVFAPPEMKMFDFSVSRHGDEFDAVFARVWMKDSPPPETGLWRARAKAPSGRFSEWNEPVQIMTAEDRGWHFRPVEAIARVGRNATRPRVRVLRWSIPDQRSRAVSVRVYSRMSGDRRIEMNADQTRVAAAAASSASRSSLTV